VLVVLSYEWNVAVANRVLVEGLLAASPEDVDRELAFIKGQLEEGTPPEGPLMERSYVIPEGMSAEEADRLWVAIAPLVSLGCEGEEVAAISENLTGLLPREVEVGGRNVTVDYSRLRITRDMKTGEVDVELPLLCNGSFRLLEYNTTGAERLHKVYNVTEFRSYRVVKRAEGFYEVTYMDLESHLNYSVVTRLSVGAYPGYSLAGEEGGPFKPSEWGMLMPELSHVLVAVPGHYEEVRTLVPAQEKRVRVLFPAYDPAIAHGWFIETQASSTALSVGEVLTIDYRAEAVNIDPADEPLSCTITLNGCEAFRPLDGLVANLDNDQTSGTFRLEALEPGTYNITLAIDGNAAFCIEPMNPYEEKHRTYAVTVSAPESPMISISLTCSSTPLKHAALEVEVENVGGGAAHNITLSLAGQIDAQSAKIGTLQQGESWSKGFTVHLRSATAGVRARASYYDSGGNLYVSEAYLTVVSPNYVVPEHFEEYTAIVPEHEETTRVFVPGYEGYTHVRLFSAESSIYFSYNFSGQLISWGYGFTGPVLQARADRGVELEVNTRFMPISTDGFELDIASGERELTLQALGHMGLPKWYSRPTVPLKYLVLSISPYVELNVTAEESRARELLGLGGCGAIDPSQVPEGYEVELLSEVISRAPFWINETYYSALQEQGWPRSGRSYIEDAHESRWDFNRTRYDAGAGASVKLVYYPLKRYSGDLVKGLALRNYASQNVSYRIRVVRPLAEQGVYISAGGNVVEVQELLVGGLSVNPFSVVQFESNVGVLRVELLKGGAVVSAVEVDMSAEVSRFWSDFWRGFWRGFSSSLPGIAMGLVVQGAVIAALMLIGPGHALAAYVVASTPIVIAGLLQAMRMAPKLQAYISELRPAYETVSGALRNQSRVYRANNLISLASAAEEKASWIEAYVNRIGVDIVFEDVLSLGFNFTDLLCALGIVEASAEQRGESVGRLTGEGLRLAVTVGTIAVIRGLASANSKLEGLSFESFLEYVKRGAASYITPPIWDAIFALKGLLGKLSNLGFLLVWRDVDDDIKELADSWKGEASKLADVGAVGAEAADLGLEEESTMRLLDVIARYLSYVGGEGIGEEGCTDLLYSLKLARQKSPELAHKLIAWLDGLPGRYATSNPLRSGVELLGRGESGWIYSAWDVLLEGHEGSFDNLLKALGMALELEPDRSSRVVELLREGVWSGEAEALSFTSDALGLACDARRLTDEANARVSILESVMGIEASSREKFEGNELHLVLDVLRGILSEVGSREGTAEALERLNRFEAQVNEVEAGKEVSLLYAWKAALGLEGSVVSPMHKYGENLRANAPLEARYLLAMKDGERFLIPVWPGEGTRTHLVNIPLEVADYLGLGEGDYLVFLEEGNGLDVAIPVKVKADNRIYLTEWFKRAFWDTGYVSEEGRIDWGALAEDRRTFRYLVAGPSGCDYEDLPLGGDDRITAYVSKDVASTGDYVLLRNPRLDVFDLGRYLNLWMGRLGFEYEGGGNAWRALPEDSDMYGYFFDEMLVYLDDHEKGGAASVLLERAIGDRLRADFGIPEGAGLVVDFRGRNLGEYYFDVFAAEKFEKEGKTMVRFRWVCEVKSDWTGRSMDEIFETKSKEALNSLHERIVEVKRMFSESKLISLDLEGSTKEGFLAVVRVTPDGFEVKYDKATVDWVGGEVARG